MSFKPLFTRAEAAQLLHVSLRTVDQLISKGDLPVVKIGKAVRIKPQTLEILIEAREARVSNH